MPSQKAQKTSRSSSAPAPEPTYELYDVAEGDRVEIYYHKKDTYYGAEVLQVRAERPLALQRPASLEGDFMV